MHLRTLIDTRPDWLLHLSDDLKINVVPDDKASPRLVSLKYNQLESDMRNPIVQQCRGTVVDLVANKIVAMPYDKFWSAHETLAHKVDLDCQELVAMDKADGSLMLLFKHDGEWKVASSGHPTAGGTVGYTATKTFKELFWEIFTAHGMQLPGPECDDMTFMFELCSLENRIVVKHTTPHLVLHGARNCATEVEWSRAKLTEVAQAHDWKLIKVYPMRTLDEINAALAVLDPMEGEGIILMDGKFNRVKMKSEKYVILHKLKDLLHPGGIVELWIADGLAQAFAAFPELESDVRLITDKLELAAANAHLEYLQYRNLPTRKEFALAVKDKPAASVIFKLYGLSLTPGTAAPSLNDTIAVMRNMTVSALRDIVDRM